VLQLALVHLSKIFLTETYPFSVGYTPWIEDLMKQSYEA